MNMCFIEHYLVLLCKKKSHVYRLHIELNEIKKELTSLRIVKE